MPPKSQLYLLAALLVAAVASAFSGRMDPYFLDVALGVGISIVLAASLNLINGFTGQFSLGHAGFMAVGAYTSAMVTTVLGPKLGASAAVLQWAVFPASLVLGGLLAALAGLAVGAPSLRLKGDYLAIVTLGFGEIIRVILQNVEAVGGARGLVGVPSYTNLFWTFGGAAVTVYVVWGLLNSTYGRGFLAVADDEVAAEAMGLNTTRYKITAFAVGSFFAGVAGGLYAHLKGYLNPSGFDFNKSIEIVVMVILGGMGKHVGVIIAAILLTAIQEPLRKFGDYRMILYSLLLLFTMIGKSIDENPPVSVLAKLLSVRGRLGRSTYWRWMLFINLAVVCGHLVDKLIFDGTSDAGVLLGVVLLWPSIALLVKRIQDRGRSPWFALVGLIPLANLWLVAECLRTGTKGDNKFGPDPISMAHQG